MDNIQPPISRRSKKKGLPPGSLVHIGSRYSDTAGFVCHVYSANSWKQEKNLTKILGNMRSEPGGSVWLQVTGLSDLDPLEPVFNRLALSLLTSEDILNTSQDTKTEIRERMIFFLLKNITWNKSDLSWNTEQISLILKPDVVTSFAEKESDLLKPVFTRMEDAGSKIRSHGSDFTFYTLTDLIVDGYLETCENMDSFIEEIEIRLDAESGYDPTSVLHQLKKFLVYFRRQVLPLRDGLTRLLKEGAGLISPDDFPYYQDVLDHVQQVISQLDQIRENLTGIRELYLTQLSIKMNKVIQLLTVISTIFIPLTFIAGIYGMNFVNMPETTWKNGYYAVMILMAMIGVSLYIYFKKKKWM